MLNVTPFLLFDGNCAEAMAFYKKCLGGELKLTTVGDMPMKDHMSMEQHHKIAYAHLQSAAIEFSATDWLHPTRKFSQGNTVAMYLNGGIYHELKQVFDRLAEDADRGLVDELKELSFGIYGHLADKYGVHWFFVGQKS
jgi:PhnB protein